MKIEEIPVSELTAGRYFKQSTRQRYFRYAGKIVDWKPGDTELLKGKRLIIQENCKQIVIRTDQTVFVLA